MLNSYILNHAVYVSVVCTEISDNQIVYCLLVLSRESLTFVTFLILAVAFSRLLLLILVSMGLHTMKIITCAMNLENNSKYFERNCVPCRTCQFIVSVVIIYPKKIDRH